MGMLLFRASPIPLAPIEYDQQYQTQLMRMLSIYFSQLDSKTPIQSEEFVGGLFTGLGRGISVPYGAFSSSANQTAASANTAYAITYNTTDLTNDVTLSASSHLTVAYSGIYGIQCKFALVNSSGTAYNADIWLKKNGTNIASSNIEFTVGANAKMPVLLDSVQSLTASDYIELFWNTANTAVSLEALSTQVSPTRPATPSAIVTVALVSAIP